MADSRQETVSEESTAASPQDLVEDVLREAQALLGADSAADAGAEPGTQPSTAGSDAEPVDVQGLVDRVDSLLGDLGHLVEDVETAEREGATPGLDLTVVLPRQAPDPKDVVPDHGPAGPQVDLFAPPEPAIEPTASPPAVVLETEATIADAASGTEPAPDTVQPSGPDSILDDLSAALADEFDEPGLAAPVSEPSSEAPAEGEPVAASAEAIDPAAAAEADLLSAMAVEFGVEPTDMPPIEDEGDPFESSSAPPPEPSDAARRLEALLAKRLAEEYDLVEQSASTMPTILESESDATELAQADIDAVARAEMEALEALGSDLDVEPESTNAVEAEASRESITDLGADAVDDPMAEAAATPVVEVAESATSDEALASDASDVPAPVADATDSAGDGDAGVADPEDAESADETSPVADDVERPAPRRAGPSVLVRIGSAPFRRLPRALHRHATPVALSLLAWVPLAWGYALFAPNPAPPRIDVLRTGFDRHRATDPSDVSHDVDAPSAVEATGDEPASGESHDAGHH